MEDELNNSIIEAMFKVFKAMKNTMSYNSESSHLTMVQFEALIFIKKNKEVQMRDISKNFKITMPTSTSLIDKLIVMRYVQRKSGFGDRRIVKINLTKQGQKLLEQAMKQRRSKINRLLSYLSHKDKNNLLKIFESVIKKVE